MKKKSIESESIEEDLLADHPLTTPDEAQREWDAQEGKLNLESILKFAKEKGILPQTDNTIEEQDDTKTLTPTEKLDKAMMSLMNLGTPLQTDNTEEKQDEEN